jgi:hypothetical protein
MPKTLRTRHPAFSVGIKDLPEDSRRKPFMQLVFKNNPDDADETKEISNDLTKSENPHKHSSFNQN